MAQEITCRNSGAISNVVDAHHGTSILAPLGGAGTEANWQRHKPSSREPPLISASSFPIRLGA